VKIWSQRGYTCFPKHQLHLREQKCRVAPYEFRSSRRVWRSIPSSPQESPCRANHEVHPAQSIAWKILKKECLTLCLCSLKQSLNITPDHKVLHYEFGCDMMECVDADKTRFLKFTLLMRQHLISGAMPENEEVKIFTALYDITEHITGREVNVCCTVTSDSLLCEEAQWNYVFTYKRYSKCLN